MFVTTTTQSLKLNGGTASTLAGDGRRRDVVCTYFSYAEAQCAIDRLTRAGINANAAEVEAEGFQPVRYESLNLHWGRTVLSGAVAGAAVGLLLSSLLGLLTFVASPVSLIELAIYGLMIGAIIGLILGGILYTLVDGEYDRFWDAGLRHRQYNLVIEHDLIGEAQCILLHAPLDKFADHGQVS